MPRKKTPTRNIRQRIVAKPNVLAKFTDEQLAAMEKRAGRRIPAKELAALSTAADTAYARIKTVEQLVRQLKTLRERRGLSQSQVDARSGIGRTNISRLENMHLDNPTLDTVLRYAQAIGAELRIAEASKPPRGNAA